VADFLLELLCEEIPARMQAKAADELRARFTAGLDAAGLTHGPVEAHVTPRRLAVLARGLADGTRAVKAEQRGPRADAPAKAIEGFARGAGVAVDALVTRDDPKGRFLYAVIERPGRAAADLLVDVVEGALSGFPWPKSMRWGRASANMDSPRWVRPLVGVVALLDESVVPLTVFGVAAGRTTCGHRFLSHCEVVIANPRAYAAQMRDAHVIVDVGERRRLILDGARACAEAAGLTLVEDEGLVAENAGLTEWPVALLGRFDPALLDLPREVIQLTMRTNQKYFACANGSGALAPAFVCVANIPGADGGAAIVEGNRRVLAARLSDARFFWEQDRAKPLADNLPRLEQVVFHEKLGTMRDKAERVAGLARWLVESGAVPGADPDMAYRAGLLAKADLTTAMVGEFPELQGVMGGYYALASGEAAEVAAAIRDHYRPVGPGDFVPVEPVSVAVALADKLDSLVVLFAAVGNATGSRDPYGQRRLASALLQHILVCGLRTQLDILIRGVVSTFLEQEISSALEEDKEFKRYFDSMLEKGKTKTDVLTTLIDRKFDADNPTHLDALEAQVKMKPATMERMETARRLAFRVLPATPVIKTFVIDRLKIQQREAGVRHDLIDAVFALGGEDDLVRLLQRVRALQAFVQTTDGANLLAAYKRAANILAIEAKKDAVATFAFVEPYEAMRPEDTALMAALRKARLNAEVAVADEDDARAMAALARLRAPIDAFFEAVMVNDPDPDVRLARLGLLQRFVDVVHQVADFSRIEG